MFYLPLTYSDHNFLSIVTVNGAKSSDKRFEKLKPWQAIAAVMDMVAPIFIKKLNDAHSHQTVARFHKTRNFTLAMPDGNVSLF